MDKQQLQGVKVTYIETQFVTSDAAGFKDLVQRLTGRSPTAAAAAAGPPALPAPPHTPRACRAGGGRRIAAEPAGPQAAGYYCYQSPTTAGQAYPAAVAPACQLQEELLWMDDFSDLFFVGANEPLRHGINGGYSDFPY